MKRQLLKGTLTALALAAGVGACDSGESTTPHPTDRLDFPVSVTADPSGSLVWVVSGNFDLRYRSSAVLAIDTATNAFVPEVAFEVGGFPGPLELLERDGRAVAGYIASRAEDDLYWVSLGGDDASRPAVACPKGQVSGGILRCPKSGAVSHTSVESKDGTVSLTLGEDPYTLEIVPSRAASQPDLLLTGAMGDGQVATLALGADGAPTLVGGASLYNGLYGLVRNPLTDRVYATSKLSSVVSVIDVAPRYDSEHPGEQVLDPVNPWLTTSATVAIPEPATTDRGRAAAISPDGTRLYVAYRAPDSLVVLDVTDGADGTQRQRVTQKIPMSNDPVDLVAARNPTGTGDLVYVSCFKGNRVEVVDPESGSIVAGIRTGTGPSGVALVDKPGLHRLYVALFNANAVGVIELDPNSPYYHTEIAEIR